MSQIAGKVLKTKSPTPFFVDETVCEEFSLW